MLTAIWNQANYHSIMDPCSVSPNMTETSAMIFRAEQTATRTHFCQGFLKELGERINLKVFLAIFRLLIF